MAAKPIKTHVEINSISVDSYILSWTIERENNESLAAFKIILSNRVDSVLTLNETLTTKSVLVQRGPTTGTETTIFRGEVTDWEVFGPSIEINALDNLNEAKRNIVTTSFDAAVDSEAGVISDIFTALITENTSLTADATSVQSSGAVDIINKFICNNSNILERCQELADILNWQMYYHPSSQKVFLEPKGFTSSGLTITVGVEIAEIPNWKYNANKLVNKLTVVGSESEVETTETFVAAAAQTTYTLQNTPQSVKVTVDGSLKTGGKTGSSSGSFDYEIDELNKQIVFQVAHAGGESVSIAYSYFLPIKIQAKNNTSITNYGTHALGLFKLEFTERADLNLFIDKYLNTFSDPFISTKLKYVGSDTLIPGQTVIVVDNVNSINKTLLIIKVKMGFPYVFDEVSVGEEAWREGAFDNEIFLRLRRLEEKIGKSTELINILFEYERILKPRRRYFKLEKQTVNTSFILGNVDHGRLGTDLLGDQRTASTTQFIGQGENTYIEFVYDTDFHDAGGSTATFNTGTNTISFTAGQVWISSAIAIGTTFSFVTLTRGTLVGSLTLEVSFNNKVNWQTVTSGVRVAITNADTLGVYIRLTESAAGVASVTNTLDSYNQKSAPALKMIMEI